MRPIRKLWRLPRADRSLLLTAAVWLAATRVGLWLLPLRVVRRWLAYAVQSRHLARGSPPSPERIAWAVGVARHVVPSATCLPQALAAEALLVRSGHPADLRIGIVKTAVGRVTAHAWVESDGRVVVGDLHDLARYAPFPPLPGIRG